MKSVADPAISPADQQRIAFLTRLDSAVAVDVTDWEARFIESFITNPRPMTPSQRDAADKMQKEYSGRL